MESENPAAQEHKAKVLVTKDGDSPPRYRPREVSLPIPLDEVLALEWDNISFIDVSSGERYKPMRKAVAFRSLAPDSGPLL